MKIRTRIGKRCCLRWGYGLIMSGAAIVLICAATLFTGSVAESKMLIYPAKGQSEEQQSKDEFECHRWAVDQTGFDPTQAQSAPQQQAPRRGGAIRGAAGGALIGAGIGAIAGDAGKGAAIGAGAGAVGGGVRQGRQNQAQQDAAQQAQANQNAQINEYNRAKAVCLEGRGYTVR